MLRQSKKLGLGNLSDVICLMDSGEYCSSAFLTPRNRFLQSDTLIPACSIHKISIGIVEMRFRPPHRPFRSFHATTALFYSGFVFFFPSSACRIHFRRDPPEDFYADYQFPDISKQVLHFQAGFISIFWGTCLPFYPITL